MEGKLLGAVAANVCVVVRHPRLSGREVAAIGPPVPPVVAHDSEQSILDSIQDQDARVGDRGVDRGHMEGEDLWKGGQEKLLRASLVLTLLTCPVRDLEGLGSGHNRLRHRLLRLSRDNRKLDHGIAAAVGVVTMLTLDQVCDLEPEELVKEWDLVAKEGDELMRIPNALSCGHCGRRLHTLVETLESLITRTRPDLGEA